jgi:epoxyqueuosine reductase QueG
MAGDTTQSPPHAELARLAGVDTFGIAAVDATRGTPLHDSATALLGSARSIVVFGMEVFPEILDLVVPEKQVGEAAARELYGPHLDYLNGRLNRGLYALARTLHEGGYRALPLPSQGTPTDARFQRGILSFKHAAEYAGLGRIGRSSLLVTPRFGPRVRLACLLTDAVLPASPRATADPCGDCPGICIETCPAGALGTPAPGEPYAINKFACASYRQGAGCCSTCLSACPAGKGC